MRFEVLNRNGAELVEDVRDVAFVDAGRFRLHSVGAALDEKALPGRVEPIGIRHLVDLFAQIVAGGDDLVVVLDLLVVFVLLDHAGSNQILAVQSHRRHLGEGGKECEEDLQ